MHVTMHTIPPCRFGVGSDAGGGGSCAAWPLDTAGVRAQKQRIKAQLSVCKAFCELLALRSRHLWKLGLNTRASLRPYPPSCYKKLTKKREVQRLSLWLGAARRPAAVGGRARLKRSATRARRLQRPRAVHAQARARTGPRAHVCRGGGGQTRTHIHIDTRLCTHADTSGRNKPCTRVFFRGGIS
jgi:hypothetical protein